MSRGSVVGSPSCSLYMVVADRQTWHTMTNTIPRMRQRSEVFG